MSNLVERDFPAKALMFGLRSMGYSFSTAVADIIDNCIPAEATRIDVYSDPLAATPFFCVLDNGHGMNRKKLDNAMLPGSNRADIPDSEIELGRFGLGLKSASLSQCREFIVVSKAFGKLNCMSFDLDVIEEKNKLFLKELSQEEIDVLPHIEDLKKHETGTLVIWTKFDNIENSAKTFEDSFRTLVGESKKHIELTFHRFYDKIQIYYNGKRIEKRDPFLLDSIGRQQTGRTTPISYKGSTITITPYTLPFAKTLTSNEKALLGNPKSIYEDQGFYIYRNHRLIISGTWLRMGIRSELNKLARIKVDIPSTLDSVWMLDVKKSTAKIPDAIKEKIKMAVEDSIVRSKRTVRNPGVKEATPEHKIWDRINEHDGNVRYQINRSNPLIQGLYNSMDDKQVDLLDDLLSLLEECIPKCRIHNDVIDSINIVNDSLSLEDEEMMGQIYRCLALFPNAEKESVLNQLLASEVYSKIAYRKDEIIGVLNNDEH